MRGKTAEEVSSTRPIYIGQWPPLKEKKMLSSFKLPFTTAHGAMRLWCLRMHPFQDTVQMKRMIAYTPNCKK